jgi:hypothetical protein
MSRTPPASIRLTCGLLNYDQVATSTYYFKSHLKDGITLENVIGMLAHNIGFVTAFQKRKTVPLLVLGVLPLYTQLRAKKCYTRILTKSYHWFNAKLFRGAQSNTLYYHNALNYNDSRATPIAQRPLDYARDHKTARNIISHDCRVFQKLTNVVRKHPAFAGSFAPGRPGSLRTGAKLPAKAGCLSNGARTKTLRESTPAQALGLIRRPTSSIMEKINTITRTAQTKCYIESIFLSCHSRGAHTKRLLQSWCATSRSSTFRGVRKASILGAQTNNVKALPQAWSKNSLFALFCLEQIIGKSNANTSHHLQGIPSMSVTTRGHNNVLKKKFKTFYDILLIQQLESDQFLKIRAGHNIPRSQIDKRKPLVVGENGDILNGTSFRWGQDASKRGHTYARLLDYDRNLGQYKSNVAPKFWVSRRFNAPKKLNLFCYFEGRIGLGSKRGAGFQKHDTSIAGWTRLKSNFVFVFDVYSKTSNDTKSLRPTICLRF